MPTIVSMFTMAPKFISTLFLSGEREHPEVHLPMLFITVLMATQEISEVTFLQITGPMPEVPEHTMASIYPVQ